MQTPIEHRRSISLPELRRAGYFDRCRSGTFHWEHNSGQPISVGLQLKRNASTHESSWLLISYQQDGQAVEERIQLVQRASNLGRGGGIWYFVCPATGRRCRTLIDTPLGFVSRHAEGGMRYQSQLVARRERSFQATLNQMRDQQQAIRWAQWLARPHSRRSYRGKLTRPMRQFLHYNQALVTENLTTSIEHDPGTNEPPRGKVNGPERVN